MNDDDGVTRDHMPSEMTSTEGGRVRRKGKRSDVVFPRGVRLTEKSCLSCFCNVPTSQRPASSSSPALPQVSPASEGSAPLREYLSRRSFRTTPSPPNPPRLDGQIALSAHTDRYLEGTYIVSQSIYNTPQRLFAHPHRGRPPPFF
jgi:hypothetical protein